MKLYIATTSLNFDTIMSTESISPVSFYSLRRFGIQHIYDKVSLCLPNSILLLGFIPDFSINRKEYDHRAMIIEIDTEFYPVGYFKEVKNGVYQTSKTIYLSPQSSSIIFLNYEDYTVTLNKSANILETKCALYKKAKRIGVVTKQCQRINGDFFNGIEDVEKVDEEALRRDKLINKAKGFITGYLIGRGKSLTAESSRLQNVTRQIKNIIYSLVTKEASERSRLYQDVKTFSNEANRLSWMLDEQKLKVLTAISDDLVAEGFNSDEIPKVRKYFSKRGLYSSLISQVCPTIKLFNIEQAIQAAANAPDDQELERRLKTISDYTNSILRYTSEDQQINDLIVFHPDLKVIECFDNSIDEESRKIIPIIYNLFSDQNIRGDEFKSKRIDYIYEVANTLKDSSNIDFQLIREYINGLLDNLEAAKAFDITSSELTAVKSFGAFIKAPDSDIEKLLSILLSNEIADHRFAVALWGIIYGYSNIPNYCFKEWVERCDSAEIQQYLCLINTQIYGYADFQCEASVSKTQTATEGTTTHKIESISETSLFPEDNEPDNDPHVTTSNTIDGKQSRLSISEYKEKISAEVEYILNNNKPKRERKQPAYISYYMDQIEIILTTSSSFTAILQRIDDISPEEGKTAWGVAKGKIKEIIQKLEKEYLHRYDNGIFNEQLVTEENPGGPKSFLSDTVTWAKIYALLPNNHALTEKFKEDFDWFRSSYFGGRYEGNPKDNKSVLDHFHMFLMKKVKEASYSNYGRVYKNLTIANVERIMEALTTLYL